MRRLQSIIVLAAGLIVGSVTASQANEAREFAISWDLCSAATYAAERENKIPRKLLSAISIAESGRRDDLNKANVAWPWTVTSGKQEWYLDSKAKAVAHVRSMIKSGIRNIDVGCMQINLHYHGKAFRTLEAAFDPVTNVRYAAEFLKKLRNSTPDWLTAAGNYHSATPKFHDRYKKRIVEIWQAERRAVQQFSSEAGMQSLYGSGLVHVNSKVPAIDTLRTTNLNDAFKLRKLAAAKAAIAEEQTAAMNGDNWKDTYVTNVGSAQNYALQAQINRLKKAQDTQKRIELMMAREETMKADRRAADLDRWRAMYTNILASEASTLGKL